MSYQALYRKYRPSTFENITGQTVTIKILQNSIVNNKVGHAYLFYGPRGTGKTSTAKIFARAVNCDQPQNGIQCEKCESCKRSIEKECLDIIEIDAASNNGVDEIRDLKSKISIVPSELKYKVYIIDEVHMLSTGAFNALLKTLEEPPEYVIFILATTELNKVPSTIISRCQLMEFKKLTEKQIQDRLSYISKNEKIDINDESLLEIAKYSNGGLRDAIGLLEKVVSYKENNIELDDVKIAMGNISNNELDELINLLFEKNINSLIEKINEYYDEGFDLSKIIYSIINKLSDDMIKTKKYDTNKCLIIKQLDDIINRMNKSDNPKLMLEISLLELLDISSDSSVKEEIISTPKIETKTETKVEPPKEEAKPIVEENVTISEENESESNVDFVDIRICNTLAKAKKNIILDIRNNWKNTSDLAFDIEHGNIARLLESDIVPVAASDEYIVLNSKTKGLANQINNSIDSVEKIIEKVFNNKYKAVCITEDEWHEYIDKYKKDKAAFVYREEQVKSNSKKTLKDKARELFED